MMDYPALINRHIGQSDLAERLLAALQNIGKDIDKITRDDLLTFDEFHSGGLEHTRRLAQLAELHETAQVLDVGCGIAGPALQR